MQKPENQLALNVVKISATSNDLMRMNGKIRTLKTTANKSDIINPRIGNVNQWCSNEKNGNEDWHWKEKNKRLVWRPTIVIVSLKTE